MQGKIKDKGKGKIKGKITGKGKVKDKGKGKGRSGRTEQAAAWHCADNTENTRNLWQSLQPRYFILLAAV